MCSLNCQAGIDFKSSRMWLPIDLKIKHIYRMSRWNVYSSIIFQQRSSLFRPIKLSRLCVPVLGSLSPVSGFRWGKKSSFLSVLFQQPGDIWISALGIRRVSFTAGRQQGQPAAGGGGAAAGGPSVASPSARPICSSWWRVDVSSKHLINTRLSPLVVRCPPCSPRDPARPNSGPPGDKPHWKQTRPRPELSWAP